MSPHKQLCSCLNEYLVSYEEQELLESNIIEEYLELNKKCDHLILKIKTRKEKKS